MTQDTRTAIHRIQTLASRGRTTVAAEEAQGVQMVQYQQWNEAQLADRVPSVQLFGFASSPPVGTDHFIVSPSGDVSGAIAIASNNQALRPRGLAEGEIKIYDSRGQSIFIRANGSIEITANSKVMITAPEVEVVASTKVTLNTPQTNLTGNLSVAGNMAIEGVSTMKGSLTADGQITSHTQVTANGINLSTHVHSGVQQGGFTTAAPQG